MQGSDQEEGERSDLDQTSCDVQKQSEEGIVQGIDQEEGERTDSDESGRDVQQQSEDIHPAIGSGDFGRVVKLKAQRPLTDREKLFALENHFVPGKHYQFQSRVFAGRQRRFQVSWLEKYHGLVYSQMENGAFCKYCVLFGQCEPRVKEFGVLVNRPLINFKKAVDKLRDHFGSKGRRSHQYAADKAMRFSAMMKKRTLAIDYHLSSQREQLAERNCRKLRLIAATTLLCG